MQLKMSQHSECMSHELVSLMSGTSPGHIEHTSRIISERIEIEMLLITFQVAKFSDSQ